MTLQLISSISATSLSSRAILEPPNSTTNHPTTRKTNSNRIQYLYTIFLPTHPRHSMYDADSLFLSQFLCPINRNITHRLTRFLHLPLHRPRLNPLPHIPHHNLPTPSIHKNNIPQPRKPLLILLIQFSQLFPFLLTPQRLLLILRVRRVDFFGAQARVGSENGVELRRAGGEGGEGFEGEGGEGV